MQVGNDQADDVIEYLVEPKTEFQRYIRLSRKGNYIALLIRRIYAHLFVCEKSFPFAFHISIQFYAFKLLFLMLFQCSRNVGLLIR